MASVLKVDKLDPQSGTALEIGTSGDTITVPTGAGLTVTDEVKTNKISPATGTAFAMGDSGDTFTIPSGATITNSGTATGFGGGKVLQVINAETSVSASSSSSTLSDTGLTAAITPADTANKILIFVNQGGLRKVTGDTSGNSALLVDIAGGGYSSLGNIGHTEWGNTASTARLQYGTLSSTVLHSPSSVGVVTYKTQFASVADIAQVDVQMDGTSRITLMELDYS